MVKGRGCPCRKPPGGGEHRAGLLWGDPGEGMGFVPRLRGAVGNVETVHTGEGPGIPAFASISEERCGEGIQGKSGSCCR